MNYLFISHAEKDSVIVKEFVELLYRVGLKENNIFCSSISEIGVPIKEDIYEYLRNMLDSENVIPIFMLSDNYYSSPACLNEMGAVWLKQKDYYTFLLPGFSFSKIKGAINPNKCGIKLDGSDLKGDLTNFKNSLKQYFKLQKISEQRWEKYRDSFIDFVKSNSSVASTKATKELNEIHLDFGTSQALCIGETNHGACESIIDKYRNCVNFRFDFNKTCAQLCSFVIFTGNINLKQSFKNGQHIEFEIKASDSVKKVNIEIHLQSMNPSKTIDINNEWRKFCIPLNEFVSVENFWESCKEVCFIVDRAFTECGEIEIKDLKIV